MEDSRAKKINSECQGWLKTSCLLWMKKNGKIKKEFIENEQDKDLDNLDF